MATAEVDAKKDRYALDYNYWYTYFRVPGSQARVRDEAELGMLGGRCCSSSCQNTPKQDTAPIKAPRTDDDTQPSIP